MAPQAAMKNEQSAADLEARLAALESGTECGEDFDAASWCWLLLLGVIIPAALVIIGWNL